MTIKKKNRDHAIGLSHDSDRAWEVRFWAKGYGTVYGYPSEETRRAGIDPYDIESRDDDDATLFELQGIDGTVEIGVAGPELLKADLTFTIRAKRDLLGAGDPRYPPR